MATWVTFSNGEQACQTGVYHKELAKAKELCWPIIQSKYVVGGEYINYQKFNPEQNALMKKFVDAWLAKEAQEYIESKWPGQGITVAKRESLPYGAGFAFGEGGRGGFFCYTPKTCAGHSSCPKRRACSE